MSSETVECATAGSVVARVGACESPVAVSPTASIDILRAADGAFRVRSDFAGVMVDSTGFCFVAVAARLTDGAERVIGLRSRDEAEKRAAADVAGFVVDGGSFSASCAWPLASFAAGVLGSRLGVAVPGWAEDVLASCVRAGVRSATRSGVEGERGGSGSTMRLTAGARASTDAPLLRGVLVVISVILTDVLASVDACSSFCACVGDGNFC